jgi:peptidoglycan/LPS O-acetylase OafA/YrhL
MRGAKFRPEIQALRAIAVLSVVLFHLWPDRLPGGYVGVDVFFVISGFLITSHLVREADETGRVKLGAFYARRARRLLPAALLVLLATLAAVIVWVPRSLWQQFATEIGSAAIYVSNWLFAANSVDYFSEGNAASPVQHYWSLSVEEQFYLVWPLLVLAVALAARGADPRRRRIALGVVFSVVFASSLVYSIVVTESQRSFAYFATPAHAWEFAAGGILSLAAVTWAPSASANRVRTVLSWLGLAAIGVSLFVFNGSSPFPGYIALLPILGALAVIAAGDVPARLAPTTLLRLRPVQYIGDVSYSLYLWHWPPIIIVPFVLDHELGLAAKFAILLATFLLASVTKRWVEDPVRVFKPIQVSWRSLTAALLASSVIVVACAVPYYVIEDESAKARAAIDQQLEPPAGEVDCFAAAAPLHPDDCTNSHVVDSEFGPAFAARDTPGGWMKNHSELDSFYSSHCKQLKNSAISRCDYGSTNPTLTVALVGDSHVNHLMPAMMRNAKLHNWHVIRFMEVSCRPAEQVYVSNVKREKAKRCLNWKHEIFDYIAGFTEADVIVTSGATQGYYHLPKTPDPELVATGFEKVWQMWTDAGRLVLAVSDIPSLATISGPQCVEESAVTIDPCAKPRSEAGRIDPILIAADRFDSPKLSSLDLYRFVCDPELCHAVVGGVIVLQDSNHMSGTFSESLAPEFYSDITNLIKENEK